MERVRPLCLVLLALAVGACASPRVAEPWQCALMGAAALGATGAVVGDEGIDEWDNTAETAVGGVVGAAVGAGLGYAICSLLPEKQPEPARAAPAPPPPPPAPPVQRERIVLRGVNFAFNSDQIDPASTVVLDVVAQTLRDNPGVRVRVEGYTDSIGSDSYNLDLSRRRAASVRSYLVGAGVSGSRLQSAGFGESNPVASNDTEEGRALNRRVELLTLE